MAFKPNPDEIACRDRVIQTILQHVRDGVTIRLPAYDPGLSRPSETFALLSVGLEKNEFGGSAGEFRYQFEGEDDLLHLMIVRQDGSPVSAESAQEVVSFLYPGVPVALMWMKPAELSQHFYLGHDVLLEYLA